MITTVERLKVAHLMKQHRKLFIHKIINLELTDLLEKSFRYEKSIQVCRIALEQSICHWINEQIESSFQISDEAGKFCVLSLANLLKKNLDFYITEDSIESKFVSDLLTEKINLMESLINFETITEQKITKMKLQISKDEALFRRIFDNL